MTRQQPVSETLTGTAANNARTSRLPGIVQARPGDLDHCEAVQYRDGRSKSPSILLVVGAATQCLTGLRYRSMLLVTDTQLHYPQAFLQVQWRHN